MKNKILLFSFIGLFVVGVIIGIVLAFSHSSNTFSLEKEYYGKDGLVDISSSGVEKLIQDKKSFILFTYNSFCSFSVPCDSIFLESAQEKNVIILQIPFEDFKNTTFHETVKYGPSVLIIKEGKIVSYLDAGKDEDIEKYQDTSVFIEWLSKYIQYA